jgi:choline monooxygenase
VELISNVCRHRQAVMLKGRGSLQTQQKGSAGGNIVCPLHRWTYSPKGELLGAPHFAHDPCLNLNNYKLREWNGLLFEDNGATWRPTWRHGPAADLTSTAMCSTASNCTSATTTGRPSSRSIWRTTTSAPSTPAWAAL